jgi:hypothetical protein
MIAVPKKSPDGYDLSWAVDEVVADGGNWTCGGWEESISRSKAEVAKLLGGRSAIPANEIEDELAGQFDAAVLKGGSRT